MTEGALRTPHPRLVGWDRAHRFLADPRFATVDGAASLRRAVLDEGRRLVILSLLPDEPSELAAALEGFGPTAAWGEGPARRLALAVEPARLTDLTDCLAEAGAPLAARLLRDAARRRSEPPARWKLPLRSGRELVLGGGRTRVMGVVNVTPDSFYPGSRSPSIQEAVARAREIRAQGACVVDIGGESTRPGAPEVRAEEELQRIVPVIEAFREQDETTLLSVDTRKAAVAEAALDAGADLVNDVSAGRHDPEILPLASERGAPVILMHMLGDPETMQRAPSYADVVAEVIQSLLARRDQAVEAGVAPERIVLDPGIGFGKTVAHNLALLAEISALRDLGHAVVIGTSRKSFIGKVLGLPDPELRLPGTLATVAMAASRDIELVRVHDVEPARQVVEMVEALRSGSLGAAEAKGEG